MPNEISNTKFISSQEAAALAGVTLKTIRDWRSKQLFDWHKENQNSRSKIRINEESFLHYLKKRDSIEQETSNGSTIKSNGSTIKVPSKVPPVLMVVPSDSMVVPSEVPSKVPSETEVLLLQQKLQHLEEKLQREQSHNQDLKAELIKKDQAIEQRDEEVKELRRKLDQKEAAHISHIGQIASLTSQVRILTSQVDALIPFQEAYNKRVNMGAIKRLFSAAEAIPIKVDLEAKNTMLLTQGEIIETDSTVEKE